MKLNFKTFFAGLIIATLLALLTTSCCRQANEFQMQKYERKHKFESPKNFWGLHISVGKKNVYKY